jgi:hypothetical protein
LVRTLRIREGVREFSQHITVTDWVIVVDRPAPTAECGPVDFLSQIAPKLPVVVD